MMYFKLNIITKSTYLIIFSYSLSLPFESFHRLYIMEASTLAGLNVFGSFRREITESNTVLLEKKKNKYLNTITI